MKKLILSVAVGTVCLMLGGCFTMDNVQSPGRARHLVAGNYGWYLFNSIPLFCGNANAKSEFPTVFFRDDVTMEKIQARFMEEVEKSELQPVELDWYCGDSILCNISLLGISIPVPYIVTYREKQLSGILK